MSVNSKCHPSWLSCGSWCSVWFLHLKLQWRIHTGWIEVASSLACHIIYSQPTWEGNSVTTALDVGYRSWFRKYSRLWGQCPSSLIAYKGDLLLKLWRKKLGHFSEVAEYDAVLLESENKPSLLERLNYCVFQWRIIRFPPQSSWMISSTFGLYVS